ncbi:MAG: hypothetical protein IT208_03375 [Chthonomonadales bacterium]|nr:hypothetical protein [Chthonomonadales bacterium]
MRYLNGFILTGFVLLFISVAGLIRGNALLTEPGMPINPYAWLEYLAASALMFVNGAVSIWTTRRHTDDQMKPGGPDKQQSARAG